MQNIKLANTEPIAFLKNFNKLVDYYHRTIDSLDSKTKSRKEVKIKVMSKFPIHKYFQTMQAIQQNNNQNAHQQADKKKIKFNKMDEQFLNKHHEFMRKTLSKMITDNQNHIDLIQRSKTFYTLKQARKKNMESKLKPSTDRKQLKSKTNGFKTMPSKDKTQKKLEQNDFDKIMGKQQLKSTKTIIQQNDKGKQSMNQSSLKFKSKSFQDIEKLIQNRKKLVQQEIKKSEEIKQARDQKTKMFLERLVLPKQWKSRPISKIYNTENYINNRFHDPTVNLKYEYTNKQLQMSQKFKKELAFHYINDQKIIK